MWKKSFGKKWDSCLVSQRDNRWTGIKIFRRFCYGALSICSLGFLALNFRVNRSDGRVLQERVREAEEKEAEGYVEREGGEGEGGGDGTRGLDEKGGRRGFPKQLAAISTDPIKINERAACEPKPLRRPVRRSRSLFLFPPLFSSLFLSFSFSIQRQRLATGTVDGFS